MSVGDWASVVALIGPLVLVAGELWVRARRRAKNARARLAGSHPDWVVMLDARAHRRVWSEVSVATIQDYQSHFDQLLARMRSMATPSQAFIRKQFDFSDEMRRELVRLAREATYSGSQQLYSGPLVAFVYLFAIQENAVSEADLTRWVAKIVSGPRADELKAASDGFVRWCHAEYDKWLADQPTRARADFAPRFASRQHAQQQKADSTGAKEEAQSPSR